MNRYQGPYKRVSDLLPRISPIGIVGEKGKGLKLTGQGSENLYKLPEQKARGDLQGGNVYLAGAGWKSKTGKFLIGYAALGAAGSLSNPEGLLGAATLGAVGGLLIHLDKKKGKGQAGSGSLFNKLFINQLKKHVPKTGSGKSKSNNKHIMEFIKKHQNKKIHISDIFGSDWKKRGKQLMDVVDQHRKQSGGNIFRDIGDFTMDAIHKTKKVATKVYKGAKKVRDAAYNELKDFANGKTAFKPSTLASVLGGVVGAVGSAAFFIPGVDLSTPAFAAASLGLSSAGKILKETGRGLAVAGGGVKIPKKYINWIKKNPDKFKIIHDQLKKGSGCTGSGWKSKLGSLALGTVGLSLYGFLKENPRLIAQAARAIGMYALGSGSPRLSDIPTKYKKYIEKNREVVNRMARISLSHAHVGSGSSAASFLSQTGLRGTPAASGAHGMYKFLLKNKEIAKSLAGKGKKPKAPKSARDIYENLESREIKKPYLQKKPKAPKSAGYIYADLQSRKGRGIRDAAREMDEIAHTQPTLPYGVSRLSNGRIKKNRYSVYHGYHKKTSGGLTKNAFFLKGKKVVSKRQSANGKRLRQQGKGIFS